MGACVIAHDIVCALVLSLLSPDICFQSQEDPTEGISDPFQVRYFTEARHLPCHLQAGTITLAAPSRYAALMPASLLPCPLPFRQSLSTETTSFS